MKTGDEVKVREGSGKDRVHGLVKATRKEEGAVVEALVLWSNASTKHEWMVWEDPASLEVIPEPEGKGEPDANQGGEGRQR
jgi:hypothetical protein